MKDHERVNLKDKNTEKNIFRVVVIVTYKHNQKTCEPEKCTFAL